MSLTMHWDSDAIGRSAADDLRAREPGSADRATCAGRSRISTTRRRQTLQRMKALGVGWTVQDAMYFGGDSSCSRPAPRRRAACRRSRRARRSASPIGAGTDAHRVASYNPFTALQWFLDGKTVGGVAIRGPEETPDPRRRAALLHDRQRLVLARREEARLARSRQARRSRGAVEGLHDRAGRQRCAASNRC